MEIHQQHGFAQVFHDTEPMARLSQDVYAVQFPSASASETNEPSVSATDPPGQSSTAINSFVNILILNRVRLNSGRVERFGAPIGKEMRVFFSS